MTEVLGLAKEAETISAEKKSILKRLSSIGIGPRIGMGFAVVLALTAIVAYIGSTGLSDFSDRVAKSDAMNKLVDHLLNARLDEKNFIIRSDDSYVAAVSDRLSTLRADAESLKATAESDDDGSRIDLIVEKVDAYEYALKAYANLEVEKRAALAAMDNEAKAFIGSASLIRTKQNEEYQTLKQRTDSMNKRRDQKLELADQATRLLSLLDSMRRAEKDFLLTGDAGNAKSVNDQIDEIVALAEAVKPHLVKPASKKAIDELIAVATNYREDFSDVVEVVKNQAVAGAKRNETLAEMDNIAESALKASADFAKVQEDNVSDLLSKWAFGDAVTESHQATGQVYGVIRLLNSARAAEKTYALNFDPAVVDEFAKFIEQATEQLVSLQMTDVGTQFATELDKCMIAMLRYKRAFKEVVNSVNLENALNEGRKELIGAMTEKAVTFESLADGIREEQKAEYAKLATLASNVDADMGVKLGNANDANRLIVIAKDARESEMNFLLSGNEEKAESLRQWISEIVTLAEEMKANFKAVGDKTLTDGMIANAQKYQSNFDNVVFLKTSQETQNQAMLEAARAVNETVLAAQTEQQAQMTAKREEVSRVILFGALIALLVGIAFAVVMGRGISVPVKRMTQAMARLASNDLEVEIPARSRRDEIGQMASAVQVFKENAIEAERLRSAAEEKERQTAEDKRRSMNELADNFEGSVKGVVEVVSSSATQMQASAEALSAIADKVSQQASAVAAATEQATANVETAAAAAEELSSSISEIGRQVNQSSQIANKAAREVETTNRDILGLADAAQKIGEVVDLITDIAEQTNLLALNATIEAARAGDAGKGFAVVASEVKNLANQTAKATEEIGQQISGVQAATQNAVKAIESIGRVINEMNEISAAIAASVEEQSAATQEISRNVQEAATGTREVATNVAGVNVAANEAGSAAQEVLTSSTALSSESETLRREVDVFVNSIRS